MENIQLEVILEDKGFSAEKINSFFSIMDNSRNNFLKLSADFLAIREVVLWAIERNGHLLKFARAEFKNDKEIVLAAINNSGPAFRFASECLRKDKEVVVAAVQKYGLALECVSNELRSDKDVVLDAVKSNGKSLRYASKELQNDWDVVLEALYCPWSWSLGALEYVSDNLKDNPDLVLAALIFAKENNRLEKDLQFVSNRLKDIIGSENPIEVLSSLISKEKLSKNILEPIAPRSKVKI